MELGPQSPENRPATRPFDPSSNGEETYPSKRPKRDHRRSSSPNFPEDSWDERRVMKYFADFKLISDEVEELHRRELEFHLDHQKRYERLRGMIVSMEARYIQQIRDKHEKKLQKVLKQERQLNAGKVASGDVSREPASTPPQISEPESHNDLRSPPARRHRANAPAAPLAAPSGSTGKNGGIGSYTTPPKPRVQMTQGFQHSRKRQLASTPEKNTPTKSPSNVNSRFQATELSEDEPPRPSIRYKGKKPAIGPGAAPAAGALHKPEPLLAACLSRWKVMRSNSPRHVEPSDGDDEDNGNDGVDAEALPDFENSERSLSTGALREDGTFHQPAGVSISNDLLRAVHVEEDEVSNFSVSLGQHPESSGESSSSESSLPSVPGKKIISPLVPPPSAGKNLGVSPFHITPESSQTLPNGTAAVAIKRPTRACRNNAPGTYKVVLDIGSDAEPGLETRRKKNLPPKRASKNDNYVPGDSAQGKSRSHSPIKTTPRIAPSARKLHKADLEQTTIPLYYSRTEGPAASTIGKPATDESGVNGYKRSWNNPEMASDEYDDSEADAGSSVGTLQYPGGSLFTDDIIKSLPPPPPIRNPRQAVRFSRKIIQKTIGGSSRNLISVVAQPMDHDYRVDQYLCPSGNLNPLLPRGPGMHGAMFVFRSGQIELDSGWHLFVSAADARPQDETHEYLGYYVVADDTDMPLAEWTNQPLKFKNAWSREISLRSRTPSGWANKSLERWGLTGTGEGSTVTQEQVKQWFNEKERHGGYARLGRRFLQFKAFDIDLYDALVEKKKELTASLTTG